MLYINVRLGGREESENPIAGKLDFLLIIIINKINKNNPVGEKQTGKQDKAGQDTRHTTYDDEPTLELQTQGDFKGSK